MRRAALVKIIHIQYSFIAQTPTQNLPPEKSKLLERNHTAGLVDDHVWAARPTLVADTSAIVQINMTVFHQPEIKNELLFPIVQSGILS